VTMATEPTQQPPLNVSDAQALKILEIERTLPWIQFSPQKHSTLHSFLATWPPSTTSQSKVAWICVRNPRPQTVDDHDLTDERGLAQAWDNACANRQPTATDLDELARQFNRLTGKWLVFARHSQIDALWSGIASATHAGTLGISAKVSPRNDEDSHVICIYSRDYTDKSDVEKLRLGLRRLGVRWKIGYKPDIYTHCGVYKGNSWGIAPTRYYT